MNTAHLAFPVFLFLVVFGNNVFAQKMVQGYNEAKNDSIQIGTGPSGFLPFIQKGYTLSVPSKKGVIGTLLFLEGSGFDEKNKSAKLLYELANKNGFAVLSVSTEIPLDFFFYDSSILTAHQIIEKVFKTYRLPNNNVFLMGAGLSGHRAMKYVEYLERKAPSFKPSLVGMMICDAPLDWVRQYNEGARDIRINYNEGAVWEGTFSTYLLKTHLKGTPKTNLESYLNFSSYSYYDEENRYIGHFKHLAMRTYMQVDIEYWLEEKRKTPLDNNGPDMVGLIAALKLAGNNNSELKVIYPKDSKSEKKNVYGTWISVDKAELMNWVLRQIEL